MKIKIKEYNKWYNRKLSKNIISICVYDIDIEYSQDNIYVLFKEFVVNENTIFEFSNSNWIDDDSKISKNIDKNYMYIMSNGGKYKYLYYNGLDRLFGVASLPKNKVDIEVFDRFIESFDGIQIFGVKSSIGFEDLLKIYHDTKNRMFIGNYLLKQHDTDFSILVSSDHNELIINFDRSKFNSDVVVSKIKQLFDNDNIATDKMKS